MNEYRFHIGDYLKHTAHLTPLEDIAYRRLLDLYYDLEGPIPNDIPAVSRRLRLGTPEVACALSEFFELREDGYHNKRADAEIAKFQAFIEKQKNNGKQGGRPIRKVRKTHRFRLANPDESQKKPNHLPSTVYQEPKDMVERQTNPETFAQSEKPPQEILSVVQPMVPLDSDFAEFYSAYPRKVGRGQARRAYATARKKTNHQAIMAGLLAFRKNLPSDAKFIPHPATWLNGERWGDDHRGLSPANFTKRVLASAVPG